MSRRIPLEKRVLGENDRVAAALAARFAEARVLALNLMSSPGAGKTTLLERTAERLGQELRMAAVEGDLATDRDAARLRRAGLPTEMINTGRGCHLSAAQVSDAVARLPLADLDVLFIENVGNLVCPSGFDLGEHRRIVLASTPEGEDKPAKYPVAFHGADLVVLNKLDMAGAAGFSREAFDEHLRGVRPDVEVVALSCRTGEGLDGWIGWLRREREAVLAEPARGG